MAIKRDTHELNMVGQTLGELLCERYGIPEEYTMTWTATGDGAEACLVKFELMVEMPLESFNDLLERAKRIAAPGTE